MTLWHITTVHELPDLCGTSWNINDPLCKLATQWGENGSQQEWGGGQL